MISYLFRDLVVAALDAAPVLSWSVQKYRILLKISKIVGPKNCEWMEGVLDSLTQGGKASEFPSPPTV